MKIFKNPLFFTFFSLLLLFGLIMAHYVLGVWTTPSCSPPDCNITLPAGSSGYIQFASSSQFGADSNLFWDNTNKRLGIGTTAPGSKLDVADTAQLRGAAGGTGLYVNSSGNVGIGTTTPGYKLDVSGDARLTGNLIATSNTLDNCAWTAYTCNASQTCPTGQVVAGVERYTTGTLCGTAPKQWYQMRLYCCNL